MHITINDTNKILEIQEKFTEMFPYLRLEFFRKTNHRDGNIPKNALANLRTLGECRTVFNTQSSVTISPQMTVSELDKLFNDVYGLSTQIFRKSGNIWLVTTVTDKWTLEEQNKQGEIITSQMKK
ncbi:MAG: hypothetical protein KGO81_06615 [Bacteroidota bacterium]|nr:hypothetical protein [Bacteroidota bacterium]